MIKNIISLRGSTRYYFYNNVFEWEDTLNRELGLPVRRINPVVKQYRQRFGRMDTPLTNDPGRDCSLAFIMNVESARLFAGYNVIPVYLDTFSDLLKQLAKITTDCIIVY